MSRLIHSRSRSADVSFEYPGYCEASELLVDTLSKIMSF